MAEIYTIKHETLKGIADAIRGKTGATDQIVVSDMAAQIENISASTELENIEIELDFSNGNQTVTAADGTTVKSAILIQPETLVPENIAEGVNIAGIIGTLAAGGGTGDGTGGGDYTVTFMSEDGSTVLYEKQVMEHDTCGEPVSLGLLETPTKDIAGNTVYSFGGWSNEANGAPEDTALVNITEDKTVYASFTSEEYVVYNKTAKTVSSTSYGDYSVFVSPANTSLCTVGKSYLVTWGETNHTCVLKQQGLKYTNGGEGMPSCLGNHQLIKSMLGYTVKSYTNSASSEPFCIVVQTNQVLVYTSSAMTKTLTIKPL